MSINGWTRYSDRLVINLLICGDRAPSVHSSVGPNIEVHESKAFRSRSPVLSPVDNHRHRDNHTGNRRADRHKHREPGRERKTPAAVWQSWIVDSLGLVNFSSGTVAT